jgi:hypothetical protein
MIEEWNKMSLILSLRISDGIVVATDSLSTSNDLLEIASSNIEIKCPYCNKVIKDKGFKLPPIPIPFSASSYTQKLLKFFKKYAISFFGIGILNKRSIYYHIKQFESKNEEIGDYSLDKIVEKIEEYFESELMKAFPDYKNKAPDNWLPIGFHINGYLEKNNNLSGITFELKIGKKSEIKIFDSIGCTVGGDVRVVAKLWEIGKIDPKQVIRYQLLSLQDAIELSEFFMNTTSIFQKFANQVPTVGGETDIALITPFHGFTWVKRKRLNKIIEEE